MDYNTDNYINVKNRASVQEFVTRVFGMMGFGLGLTALVSFITLNYMPLLSFAIKARMFLMIGDIGLVIYLASRALKMSPDRALTWFLFYSALNGLTFAPIFLIYTSASVAKTFFICSGMFGAMAFWGYSTKKDLTSMGSFAFMGLIGLIIASIANIFVKSSGLGLLISYAGVGIFIALTAWDVQKLKRIAQMGGNLGGLAVLGALTLYLDFINLFIHLLSILGVRRD